MGLASWLMLLKRRWIAHLVFFALALMAKETALALPLVWGAAWVARRRPERWGLVAGGWAALVVARFAVHPGAPHATAGELLANARLLPIALGQLVLPLRPTAIAVAEDLAVWPGFVAAGLVALAAWRLPGVRRGVVAYGALAFVVLLGPVLAVPGTLVLDQRLVLPAVGVLLVLGELVRAAAPEPRTLAAFAGIAVAALALVASGFEGTFRNPAAFAREAVAASPAPRWRTSAWVRSSSAPDTTTARSRSTGRRWPSGPRRSCTTA